MPLLIDGYNGSTVSGSTYEVLYSLHMKYFWLDFYTRHVRKSLFCMLNEVTVGHRILLRSA